jgi:hypothetical protein
MNSIIENNIENNKTATNYELGKIFIIFLSVLFALCTFLFGIYWIITLII